MTQIVNRKILSTLVRGFFDAFYSGLTDATELTTAESRQPKKIKEVMSRYYEKISVEFNDTMFYPISCLNYTYEEIGNMLKTLDPKNTDMLELVKRACRSDEFFENMKAEYCRNLLTMLDGQYPDTDTWFAGQQPGSDTDTPGNHAATTDADKAIGMAVRTVMTAYARGLRQSGKTEATLRQATVFRLVLDTMTTLLHDNPIDGDTMNRAKSFEELVMAVCLTSHNIDVMTDEMNRMHEELISF